MTGRVTGIGGVFFRAEDPKALAEWYTRHLGVTIEDFWPQEAGNAVLAPFKADTDYWSTDKQWMINFRVSALADLVERLQAAGIAVERRAEWDSPGSGRFARIVDPEGNAIELWEPA